MTPPTPRAFAILLAATLAALPLATATHDADPIPDGAESFACGFPALASTLLLLPPSAGRCVTTTDYSTPFFEAGACAGCATRTDHATTNHPLTPVVTVPAVALPPAGVDPQGPVTTPPLDAPLGVLHAQRLPGTQSYCVTFTPEGGGPLSQCVDVGPLADVLPPIPPTSLLEVGSQSVGPTPGVPAGSLGATPAQREGAKSFDLSVTHSWSESRLNQRVGPGLVNAWEPVDADNPAALQWWAENGAQTPLTLRVTLRDDGAPVQTVAVHVPYVGQAAAALLKNAGA